MTYSLRRPRRSDMPFFERLLADDDVRARSLHPEEFSHACLEAWLDNYDDNLAVTGQERWMIVDSDGQAVGHVDLADYDPLNLRASVGITVVSTRRRRGAALAALRLVEAEARKARLVQVYALVAPDNDASLALFRKALWREAGLLRRWLNIAGRPTDCILFQRLLTDTTPL